MVANRGRAISQDTVIAGDLNQNVSRETSFSSGERNTNRGDQVKLVRTTIEIDDALMERAMRVSGVSTESAAVQMALEFMVRRAEEQETLIRLARGKVRWEGDLTAMRRDRIPSR
jgi:Arc/MetJ family transcription regulator